MASTEIYMSKTRLKVLIVSPTAPPAGGMETWTDLILKSARTDNEIELFHVDTRLVFRKNTSNSLGARLFFGFFETARISAQTLKILLVNRIDVLHISSVAGMAVFKDIILVSLARLRGTRTIVHYHVGRIPDEIRKWPILKIPIRLCNRISNKTVVLGEIIKKELENSFCLRKIIVLPNGIRLQAIEPFHPQTGSNLVNHLGLIVGFVGKVHIEKGIIEAVQSCRAALPFVIKLDVIGIVFDSMKQWTEQVVKESPWIEFHGQLSHEDTLKKIAGCSILLLPSYTEGLPYVILEAMSLGVPVIATKVGAVEEVLGIKTHNPAGICVPIKNVDSIVAAIKILATNQSELTGMSANGLKRVKETYAIEKIYKRIKILWGSLETQN